MTYRLCLIVALLVAAFTAPSFGQMSQGGERLLLAPDPSWPMASRQGNETMSMVEYVPAGETVQNWSRKLMVQVFPNDKTSLADWVQSFRFYFPARWNCDGKQLIRSLSGWTNGYEWMRLITVCNRSLAHNSGEFSLLQFMRGRDNIYVVQRAWRGPAFAQNVAPVPPEEFREWVAFMDKVSLCDSRYREHPCPVEAAQ
jgi:hypothetical protein